PAIWWGHGEGDELPTPAKRIDLSCSAGRAPRGAPFMETIGLLMETIGLRTLSFFSRTIRVSRTNATVSRRYEQGRVLPPTSVVFPTAGEQPAALPPADAT